MFVVGGVRLNGLFLVIFTARKIFPYKGETLTPSNTVSEKGSRNMFHSSLSDYYSFFFSVSTGEPLTDQQ